MQSLDFIYFLGDFDDRGDAALEASGQCGLRIGLLLKDEGGE